MATDSAGDTAPPKKQCSTPYFTDKLSAETRIMIYKHIFGPGERVKLIEHSEQSTSDKNQPQNQDSAKNEPVLIETSILAANKLIHNEAIETLFNNKIVRLTFDQLDALLKQPEASDLIRDIEITDCETDYDVNFIHGVLIAAQRLPRVRSITILSDCLAKTGPLDQHTTVRQYCEKYRLGEVRAKDIGRYDLIGTMIKFAHSKLLNMWPHVASTPDDYNPAAEVERIDEEWPCSGLVSNLMAWTSHTSLRLWVALYEIMTNCYRKEDGTDAEQDLRTFLKINSWARTIVYRPYYLTTPDDVYPLNGTHASVPLHKLGAGHDPVTIESATELLSMNIQSYIYRDLEMNNEYCRPRWAELGERPEREIEYFWQKRQQELLKQYHFIADPIRPHRFWSLDNVKELLTGSSYFRAVLGEAEIQNADKEILQKMLYLYLASTDYIEADDDAQQVQIDEWRKEMMVKYLKCDGTLKEQDLQAQTVETLQRVIVGLLVILCAQEGEANTSKEPDPSSEEQAGDRAEDNTIGTTGSEQRQDEDIDHSTASKADAAHHTNTSEVDDDPTTLAEESDLFVPFVEKAKGWMRVSWLLVQTMLVLETKEPGRQADEEGNDMGEGEPGQEAE